MTDKRFVQLVVGMMQQQKHLIDQQITQLEEYINTYSDNGHAPAGQKQKKAKADVDPNKPKRSPSGYNLFMTENASKCKELNPTAASKDIMTMLGAQWKELDENVKAKYLERASQLKTVYDQQLKDYNELRTGHNQPSSSATLSTSSSEPQSNLLLTSPSKDKKKRKLQPPIPEPPKSRVAITYEDEEDEDDEEEEEVKVLTVAEEESDESEEDSDAPPQQIVRVQVPAPVKPVANKAKGAASKPVPKLQVPAVKEPTRGKAAVVVETVTKAPPAPAKVVEEPPADDGSGSGKKHKKHKKDKDKKSKRDKET